MFGDQLDDGLTLHLPFRIFHRGFVIISSLSTTRRPFRRPLRRVGFRVASVPPSRSGFLTSYTFVKLVGCCCYLVVMFPQLLVSLPPAFEWYLSVVLIVSTMRLLGPVVFIILTIPCKHTH